MLRERSRSLAVLHRHLVPAAESPVRELRSRRNCRRICTNVHILGTRSDAVYWCDDVWRPGRSALSLPLREGPAHHSSVSVGACAPVQNTTVASVWVPVRQQQLHAVAGIAGTASWAPCSHAQHTDTASCKTPVQPCSAHRCCPLCNNLMDLVHRARSTGTAFIDAHGRRGAGEHAILVGGVKLGASDTHSLHSLNP